VQSLTGSKVVEISEDRKHMRTRDNPGRWSLSGVEPQSFSSLNASVPEFVPGQMFRVAPTPSSAADAEQPQASDKDSPAEDTASEVSSRLEEMCISVATAAEPASSEDRPAAAADGYSDTEMQPDTLADVADDQDSAVERLNMSADEKQSGK